MKTIQPIMFYDGGCPVCKREVAHYIRLDKQGRVSWVDIHNDPEQLEQYNIDLPTAMARLHVIDQYGGLQTGAHAFATIWEHLPYYKWLGKIVRGLHMLPVLDFGYRHFADWRFKRRCQANQCSNSN